jgi:hypothetical protein
MGKEMHVFFYILLKRTGSLTGGDVRGLFYFHQGRSFDPPVIFLIEAPAQAQRLLSLGRNDFCGATSNATRTNAATLIIDNRSK